MRRKLVLCLLLFTGCVQYGIAQDFWRTPLALNAWSGSESAWSDSIAAKRKSFVGIEGNILYGCDGMHNDFLMKMYKGGFIDSAYIEKSAETLLPSNRVGATFGTGITYGRVVNDSTREYITVSLLRRSMITGRFSDDAFRLAFQGNQRFKGEEADFGGTRFNFMSWTQLRIGYVTPKPDSKISFCFSLLAGHNYNQGNIRYGKLYTDSQGTLLHASVYADYWSSDTTNRKPFALNGWGTSVDVSWEKTWKDTFGNKKTLSFDFIDFGFINWSDRTVHRYADTSFNYYGIDISQFIINPDYVTELPEEGDFIKTDTTEFHSSVFLPAIIRGSYVQKFFKNQLGFKATCAVPLWSEALPFGSLTGTWSPGHLPVTIETGVAYGGYCGVQVPVGIAFLPGKCNRFALQAGTSNLLGVVLPDSFSGYGFGINLSYSY